MVKDIERMRYLILLGDGMADYPLKELGDKTPLQVASTPAMDLMAKKGKLGLVSTIPTGFSPGSDVANLSIMGYDPTLYYPGRAALEAASMGIKLSLQDVAFRCNLVTFYEQDNKIIMEDYSAGHIETDDARKFIEELKKNLADERIEFYTGLSYRHLLVWKSGVEEIETTPPHDIIGKDISDYLPKGPGADFINKIMIESQKIFKDSEINRVRISQRKKPVSSIWLWGQGRAVTLPLFKERFDLKGGVISAVDLIRGIGITIGFETIIVPGATGYLNTNYLGKAEYALKALEHLDLVYIHVEAPDEASHNGDLNGKLQAIEDFDSKVVKTVLEGVKRFKEWKVMVLPDHPTPLVKRTHTSEPVPFAILGSKDEKNPVGELTFDEDSAARSGIFIQNGYQLIDYFIKRS